MKIITCYSMAFTCSLWLASISTTAQVSPDCSNGFSVDRIQGENVLSEVPALDWVPQGGDVLDLSASGEATLFRRATGRTNVSTEYPGSWNLDENCVIELQYTGGSRAVRDFVSEDDTSFVDRYGFEPSVADFFISAGIFELFINEEFLRQSITRVSTDVSTDIVTTTDSFRYTFDEQFLIDSGWVGPTPIGEIEETKENILFAADSLESILPEDEKFTGTWALSHVVSMLDIGSNEIVDSASSDLFVFHRTGNQVKGLYSEKTYRWNQSGAEITLFNEQEAYLIKPFVTDGSVYTALTTRFVNGERERQFVTWVAKVRGNAVNFPSRATKKLPKSLISRINTWTDASQDEGGNLMAQDIFGYNFNGDATMGRVAGIEEGFGCIDITRPCFIFEGIDWTWRPSVAQLAFQRVTTSQERMRTWDVINNARGKTVVLESANIKIDNNFDGDFDDPEDTVGPFFTTRVNILTTTDLSDNQEAWFNSLQPAQRAFTTSMPAERVELR